MNIYILLSWTEFCTILFVCCLLFICPLSRVQIVCGCAFVHCDCTACLWRIAAIPGQACGVIGTQIWHCANEPVIVPALGKVWESVLSGSLPHCAISLFERSVGKPDHPDKGSWLNFSGPFWKIVCLLKDSVFVPGSLCVHHVPLTCWVLHGLVLWKNHDFIQKVNFEWGFWGACQGC